MIYQNSRTGVRIDVSALTEAERNFYRAAKQRFDRGVAWFDFDDFAFGGGSPLYQGRKSHHEVLQHPLYIVLKDMWLELGVRQGRVRAGKRARGNAKPPKSAARAARESAAPVR